MGRLTTHVLDTANGRPARGVKIELYYRVPGGFFVLLGQASTNAEGRTDQPLLEGDRLKAGTYQLVFHAGEYFRSQPAGERGEAFIDVVPVRFGVSDAGAHYHVPLLCTPWSYSTYRGS